MKIFIIQIDEFIKNKLLFLGNTEYDSNNGFIKCQTYLGVNGATNIYRIAKNAINGLERLKYLCRKKEG